MTVRAGLLDYGGAFDDALRVLLPRGPANGVGDGAGVRPCPGVAGGSRVPGGLYVRLHESLYIWFGNLGGVLHVLAIVLTVATAVLLRHDPPVRRPTGATAGLEVPALATFITIVYPVNPRLPVHSAGAAPTDWAALRNRWKLGAHARVRAVHRRVRAAAPHPAAPERSPGRIRGAGRIRRGRPA